jgi:hypothetical protein
MPNSASFAPSILIVFGGLILILLGFAVI